MKSGSKTNAMSREQLLAAVRAQPRSADYEWDGKDEDDRPLSAEELAAGLEAARQRGGRPAGSGTKEVTTLRLDRDVLAALRASGAGWQTRVNALLREAVEQGRLGRT